MSRRAHEREGHVDGSALYVDDRRDYAEVASAQLVCSTQAHARLVAVDIEAARALTGVYAVWLAADVPGKVNTGVLVADEPLLAQGVVHYVGQPIALVVAKDPDTARRAAQLVHVAYDPLESILDIPTAIARQSFIGQAQRIARGEVEQALALAHLRCAGRVESGPQNHFYLETHASLAVPEEDDCITVYCSTQHPSGVQSTVAAVLALPQHRVRCIVDRLGGGFGGKESQAQGFAALASWAAHRLHQPVRLRLDRDLDMVVTGHRHPFLSDYEAGFDQRGRITALRVHIYSDGGFSADLSGPVLDRALFHLDNAYYIPELEFQGRVCRTHKASNTAFRGFGGPQGMAVIESILDAAAGKLGLDAAQVRAENLYGPRGGVETPYGQRVDMLELPRLWAQILTQSDYARRREQIELDNRISPWTRRGIAATPVKFGISFTHAPMNQGSALLMMYTDGSVQLNHGGVEMGQGLREKLLKLCCASLGVTPDKVRDMPTSTDEIANTPPTAASSGTDLNGAAIVQACTLLRERLAPLAAEELQCPIDALEFRDGQVWCAGAATGTSSITLGELAQRAWAERISLMVTAHHATPGITYDRTRGRGTPFFYFACGAAVSEVEINLLTGEHRLCRVDILHDVGHSLASEVDRGQIIGAFTQGLGWLTREQLVWNSEGRLTTHGPSTYKIPTFGDMPSELHLEFFDGPPSPAVAGSKAVGEPPLMLALSVLSALRHALAQSPAGPRAATALGIPCTPESVLRALHTARGAAESPGEVLT